MQKPKYKIAFIEPSPNWHCPERHEKVASHERIDLMVYFCSRMALNGKLLSEAFGVKDQNWGQNLVKGYKHKFLKNISLIPPKFNRTRLFSHFNPGIWKEITKGGYDAILVTMWNDITYWIAAMAGRFSNKPVLFIGDSTILTEEERPLWLRKIKKVVLGKFLFPLGTGFLYRNEMNRQFFLHYGVPEERLFFYPYSVNYETYFAMYQSLKDREKMIRQQYGIREDAFVTLFVGRLAEEKRPLDLVNAFETVKANNKALIFIGDGKLRDKIEGYIREQEILGVHLTGFKSKSEVLWYYLMADVLVLPSGFEPHGEVINEAMCFGLPVIVSDKVGAAGDLVKHNENGFVYPCGDTEQLARYIDELSDKDKRECFGQRSLEIIKDWSHDKAVAGLIDALEHLCEE